MKKILIIFAMLISEICIAQDLIYLKNKKILEVELIEYESETVSYKEYKSKDKQVYIVLKSDIIKIKTKSGKEIQIAQEAISSLDKKNIIKTDIFSIAGSKFTIGYERSISPKKTWEIQLGIIGIGVIPEDVISLSGTFLRFGLKFKRSPDYYSNKGVETNLFKGQYFKPEIVIGGFSETRQYYDWYKNHWSDPYTRESRIISFAALILNYGKQWTISDDIAIDLYFGAGYGTKTKDNSEYKNLNYPVFTIEDIFFQSGFKLGYIF